MKILRRPSSAGRGFAPWLTLALLALALPLSACGGAPPPAEHFYRLTTPVVTASAKPLPGILVVERLRADGVTGERPMAHSRADQPQSLDTYRYHFWTEAPGRMLQQHLAKSLNDAKSASQVMTDEAKVEGAWLLKGRLMHFEQVLGSQPKVVIEADMTLMKAKDYSLVHRALYREEEPAQGESPAAAVDAMQKAFARLCLRIAADMKAP
ncbi:ABC-type uncharacterized transport system, auxiliary component [Rhodospirillaceae bacterium LM-1]|nr:ABC-type uncharacterized transport system, auxiliary component [Rhodospirillaceae bacterium LM-1]